MASQITLEADLKANLGKCKVGDSKTVTVTFTVEKEGESVSGPITGVSGYEKSEKEDEPKPALKNNKRPPAVAKALEEAGEY